MSYSKNILNAIEQLKEAQDNADYYILNVKPKLKNLQIEAYINLSNELQNIKEIIRNYDFLPLEVNVKITDKYDITNHYIVSFDKTTTKIASKYLKGELLFKDNINIETDSSFINNNIIDEAKNELFLAILSVYDDFYMNLNNAIMNVIIGRTNQNNNFYEKEMNQYNIYESFNKKFKKKGKK